MSVPLLTTKLQIPPARRDWVSRPRLLEELTQGLERRLILVSAPAGFGKTTLLAEWARRIEALAPGLAPALWGAEGGAGAATKPILIGWLSLDKGDNDPVRFLAYLVAALARLDPHLAGHDLEPPPSAPQPQRETYLTTLVNRISSAFPRRFVLVLDDYHLITAQAVQEILSFLLDYQPDNLHLVIASRADPPLAIARLRGRRQLVELRQADLRFTAEEAATFLTSAMQLRLSSEDVAALEARTEGWIAGLQMAALSLQGRLRAKAEPSPSGFIHAFTGSHRYVLDFLLEEVVEQQPAAVQEFLLKTSILESLTAPLCDAVLRDWSASAPDERDGRPDHDASRSQSFLEYLDSANLFIVPLDDGREWYRYHRLFADLLRARLHQVYPELVPTLHLRASEWYEAEMLLAQAIDHALASEQYDRAVRLVEQAADETLMRSEVATLLGWLERLPQDLIRDRPSLCLYHAWALFLGGHPWSMVEETLQALDRSAEAGPISDWTATLRAVEAILQGQVATATELSQQALARLPEGAALLRGLAAWSLASSYLSEGNVPSAVQLLEEMARRGRESGNLLVAGLLLCSLAEVAMRQGHLHQARATFQQVLDLASGEEGHPLPIAGQALLGIALLALQWNDLETAERCFAEGLELACDWSQIHALDGYLGWARLKQVLGDEATADQLLESARRLAVQFDATQVDDWVVALVQAQLWMSRAAHDPQALEAVRRWVDERGLAEVRTMSLRQDGLPSNEERIRKYELITVARLHLVQGRATQALTLLDSLLPIFEKRGRLWMVLEILLLRAQAHQALANRRQALACLRQALAQAEPEGFVRVFVDEGEPVRLLLHRIAGQGIAADYVTGLLAAFAAEQHRVAGQGLFQRSPAQPVADPLSDRELEVLRLLASGRSNPEIAEHLVLSVHTVRSHCKNIYSKMGVHSRWDAVHQARDLGVI